MVFDSVRAQTSVVVVSHNEGENLLRTVRGLLDAMPANDEIIVVDDMSNDGSIEALPLDQIRVVRPEKRLGISAARNLGASLATGDFLIFCDGHVDVAPGFLEPLLEVLRRPGVAAVGPTVSMRDNPSAKGMGFRWRDPALSVEWLDNKGRGTAPFPVPMLVGCFMLVRRDIFIETEGYDDGMIVYGYEDAELSMRLWTLGYQCLLVPSVDVAHLFRSTHTYEINWTANLHNLLRVAIVNFSSERFRRVIACLKNHEALPTALGMLLDGDAYERRRKLHAIRVRDDDWYFKEFHMHW